MLMISVIFPLLLVATAYSHSGGIDSQRGHNDCSDSTYAEG